MESSGSLASAKDFLNHPDRKRKYNKELFTVVAPRYQFVTRALSFGRDQRWKKQLIAALPEIQEGIIVDLACGTGDISLALAHRYRDAQILGIDLTAAMVQIAAARTSCDNLGYVSGDMHALALDDASVSLVTGGYALRNAPDLDAAIAEIARILKPGAIAAFLDFSKPAHRIGQMIEYRMLHFWGSLWGMVLHRNPAVYAYIAESLRSYPDRISLQKMLNTHQLSVLFSRTLFWGFAELTLCRKAL